MNKLPKYSPMVLYSQQKYEWDVFLQMLRELQAVAKDDEVKCPICEAPMKLGVDSSRYSCSNLCQYWCMPGVSIQIKIFFIILRRDGYRFWCGKVTVIAKPKTKKVKRQCPGTASLRKGTFFENSKLDLCQNVSFVNLWTLSCRIKQYKEILGISPKTVVDWASFCREVLLEAFVNQEQQMGGVGIVVEIDESKFGRRKYNVGHEVDGKWVFGIYERGTGRVHMEVVEDR